MKNSKNQSKTMLATCIILSVLASNSAFASNDKMTESEKKQMQTHNENIGFGSGAVIGGIVAGPIGVIVAGVGGAFIAKYINVNNENEALNTALSVTEQEKLALVEQTEQEYQTKINKLTDTYQQQLVALEQAQHEIPQLQAENLLMSLQFSTGSSEIAPHYQEQVAALAQILNSTPNMQIDLSGYTDLTGESSLNKTLSLARVTSVKQLLMAQGVSEQQIATFAYGEEAPVVANSEHKVSFYDRRVVLKLHMPSTQTARN